MPVFEEKLHVGRFILAEKSVHHSREYITIAAGQVLDVGTVLSRVPDGDNYLYHALDFSAHDGREIPVAVLFDRVDATERDEIGVAFVRNCELMEPTIQWPESTEEQKLDAISQLELRSVWLRGGRAYSVFGR